MLATYITRLGLSAASTLRAPKLSPLDEVPMALTIWPQDIDVYGHLNNGRYLTLMDNGRWVHSMRTGLLKLMLEKKWIPVLGAAAIEFRRELRTFQRCTLTTRYVGWDSKWIYIEHRLMRGEELHARAIVRAVVKHGKKTISAETLFAELGLSPISPLSPEQLAAEIQTMVVPQLPPAQKDTAA